MSPSPLILVTSCVQSAGFEMADRSISLSYTYQRAILNAGGLPLALPCIASREMLAQAVRYSDGVLLTGGDDLDPDLYAPNLPPEVRAKVRVEAPERDRCELDLIAETFRQRRPMLAICRGHQILNVAFGGTLVADIPIERPSHINHNRMDDPLAPVHDAEVLPGSLLAEHTGHTRLGVNSTHHQAVDRVAEPFEVVARAPDGIIEALGARAGTVAALLPFLLSVQFHPERLADRHPEHRAIFEAFVRKCAATARQRGD